MRRLTLFAALAIALPAQTAPDSWTQFRRTPALTGVAAQPLPDALRLLWTYEAGPAVESSAAIADGKKDGGKRGDKDDDN